MPSYLNYRDVAAVIQAGAAIEMAGNTLYSAAMSKALELGGKERSVITQRDDYGRTFWTGTYNKDNFNGELRVGGVDIAEEARKAGKSVVKAANEVLWLDALAGAAILPESMHRQA
jgi:hypothetical protein